MALRIYLPSASIRPSSPQWPASRSFASPEQWPSCGGRVAARVKVRVPEGRGERVVVARSSMETVVTVGQVTEVNKDTFWPIVEAATPKVVVLDMYTQWYGF